MLRCIPMAGAVSAHYDYSLHDWDGIPFVSCVFARLLCKLSKQGCRLTRGFLALQYESALLNHARVGLTTFIYKGRDSPPGVPPTAVFDMVACITRCGPHPYRCFWARHRPATSIDTRGGVVPCRDIHISHTDGAIFCVAGGQPPALAPVVHF